MIDTLQLQGVIPFPPATAIAWGILATWYTAGWFWLAPALAEAGAGHWEQRHPLQLAARRARTRTTRVPGGRVVITSRIPRKEPAS